MGADPHIEDLAGLDACDYAKKYGIASTYEQLSNCLPHERKKPTFEGMSAKAIQVVKATEKQRRGDKYAAAYKDLSENFIHKYPKTENKKPSHKALNESGSVNYYHD